MALPSYSSELIGNKPYANTEKFPSALQSPTHKHQQAGKEYHMAKKNLYHEKWENKKNKNKKHPTVWRWQVLRYYSGRKFLKTVISIFIKIREDIATL